MKEYVLDCSVTIAWCFESENTAFTSSLLKKSLQCNIIVPNLWHIEVTNVLLQAEKNGRIDALTSAKFLSMLSTLPIETETNTHDLAFTKILTLAKAYKLTAYDACYLEICTRRNLPLATLDKDLRKAAQACHVEILK